MVLPAYEEIEAILPMTLAGAKANASAVLLHQYDYPEDDGTNYCDEQGKRFLQQLAGLEVAS